MKINIEVDLTPEEARAVMGLPDIAPMQEELMGQITEQIRRNVAYVDPELIVKSVLPMGAEGLDRFQKLLWSVARSAVREDGEGDSAPAEKPAKRPRKRS